MRTKVRKIGNSQGILLPQSIINQCNIKDEVTVEVRDKKVMIMPIAKKPREGWEEQFLKAGSLEDKELLMGDFSNDFDHDEWVW